jgi:hypothetical protein
MGHTSHVCITRKQDKRFTRKPNIKVKWGISWREWLSHAEKVIVQKSSNSFSQTGQLRHYCGTGAQVDS